MKKINSKVKRLLRNRTKLKKVNIDRYRVAIFKSLKNISAQIIDDKVNKTIVSASSMEKNMKKEKKNKTDLSILLGEVLAKRATEKKINKVYFDRGSYKYHGRIKALAESLRKNGLNF
jgi:large subunit ribosomal protein L18